MFSQDIHTVVQSLIASKRNRNTSFKQIEWHADYFVNKSINSVLSVIFQAKLSLQKKRQKTHNKQIYL